MQLSEPALCRSHNSPHVTARQHIFQTHKYESVTKHSISRGDIAQTQTAHCCDNNVLRFRVFKSKTVQVRKHSGLMCFCDGKLSQLLLILLWLRAPNMSPSQRLSTLQHLKFPWSSEGGTGLYSSSWRWMITCYWVVATLKSSWSGRRSDNHSRLFMCFL